jgi:uncharacterized protein (TIGR00369 family)
MSTDPTPGAPFGFIDPAALKDLDGLTLMQRMAAGELPGATMAETMNFRVKTVENGRVVFTGMPTRGFFNPLGTVHGGWFATLLDSCMGCAIHTTLGKGIGYTTIEIKANFVRALTLDNIGPVEAEGRVTHPGRRIALADGRITDAQGRLVATGTTSCLIFGA